MAAAGISLSTAPASWKLTAAKSLPRQPLFVWVSRKQQSTKGIRTAGIRTRAAPERIQGKVEESIKKAEEACSDDPVSGECVAAWDEVEELSAAASHARDKKKGSDPLEEYCKDNPETDECRTYDN